MHVQVGMHMDWTVPRFIGLQLSPHTVRVLPNKRLMASLKDTPAAVDPNHQAALCTSVGPPPKSLAIN